MDSESIYKGVVEAMQNAEELGGPEGIEYVALMLKISEEANRRAQHAVDLIKAGEC